MMGMNEVMRALDIILDLLGEAHSLAREIWKKEPSDELQEILLRLEEALVEIQTLLWYL